MAESIIMIVFLCQCLWVVENHKDFMESIKIIVEKMNQQVKNLERSLCGCDHLGDPDDIKDPKARSLLIDHNKEHHKGKAW